MIAVLRQVSDPGNCEGARWAGMRIHRISSPMMLNLGYSSKLNGEWDFLSMLHAEGRRCATAFLAAHGNDIGHRSTLDLDALLDDAPAVSAPPRRASAARPKAGPAAARRVRAVSVAR
jgi:NTE family protein